MEQYRSPRRELSRSERLAEGKVLLRERARELGIALANDPETTRAGVRLEYAVVQSRSTVGKVRSPVG